MSILAFAIGWAELLILLLLFALPLTVAGVVLLAVGLTQKRRPLWISGIVLLALPAALLLLGLALLVGLRFVAA